MITRAISPTGDWTFGNGKGNYLTNQAAIAQNIQTGLYQVIGDCFFNLGAGVDWFGFMSSKNLLGLNLAIRSVIINIDGVIGVVSVSDILTTGRKVTFTYSVVTVYGDLTSQFEYSIPNAT